MKNEQKLLITHFQFSQICDDHDYGDDNDYGHNATNHEQFQWAVVMSIVLMRIMMKMMMMTKIKVTAMAPIMIQVWGGRSLWRRQLKLRR